MAKKYINFDGNMKHGFRLLQDDFSLYSSHEVLPAITHDLCDGQESLPVKVCNRMVIQIRKHLGAGDNALHVDVIDEGPSIHPSSPSIKQANITQSYRHWSFVYVSSVQNWRWILLRCVPYQTFMPCSASITLPSHASKTSFCMEILLCQSPRTP